MIEPVVFHAGLPAITLSAVPALSASLPMPAVAATDQLRFQAALHRVSEPAPSAMAPIAVASERVAAPGDLILRGLERLRGEHRALSVELDTLSGRAEMNPMELLNLQMQVTQVTLGTQLIGQIASKLEQNLNTLLKSQ